MLPVVPLLVPACLIESLLPLAGVSAHEEGIFSLVGEFHILRCYPSTIINL